MNIKQIILAATVFTLTGAVFADALYPVEKPFVSTKTRAEVSAEVVQAQALKLMQIKSGIRVSDLYAGH